MRITIELVIHGEDSQQPEQRKNVLELERSTQTPASAGLGLTLKESKTLLKHVQQNVVAEQAACYVAQASTCPSCGCHYTVKENRNLIYRTLFGKLKLNNPRFYTACQCDGQRLAGKSFSPLANRLKERSHPDLIWVETQLAAWLSFRHAAIILQSMLPLEDAIAVSSIKAKTQTIGQRLEAEWETKTQAQFCHPSDIYYDDPTQVPSQGLQVDAGYIKTIPEKDSFRRHRLGVVIARSFIAEGALRCHAYIDHPEMLGSCRIQAFLKQDQLGDGVPLALISDAGNDIQSAIFISNRPVKYVLDWFHIAMRYEHLLQTLRGLPEQDEINKAVLLEAAEHSKWLIWHGKSDKAIQRLQTLEQICTLNQLNKPLKTLAILINYLQVNQIRLIHYAEQHRLGLPMSSSQAESAVSTVIAERMRWRMRWSGKGAQAFLQVRCAVLNGDLGKHFSRWYPEKLVPQENQNAYRRAA